MIFRIGVTLVLAVLCSVSIAYSMHPGHTRESLEALKAQLNELGAPTLQGTDAVTKGQTFCGDVTILDLPYDTCYESIKADGKVIGIYYVGYKIR